MTPRTPRTARTVVELEPLLAEIDRVREQGWCVVDQELEDGLVSMAAPLTDRSGRTVAALNVSASTLSRPAPEMAEKVLPRLLEAVQKTSASLPIK